MSTRSTIKFYDTFKQDVPVLAVYQQFDGYIGGVGHELAEWLKDKKVINGIGGEHTMENGFANGIGCLAAQYVADHKTGIGGFYTTVNDDTQEFNYEVRFIEGKIQIKVDDLFIGTPEELLNFNEDDSSDTD